MEKKYTEQDLINACKYGYEYHKTSQFPNTEFEEFCMNNFKQLLESKKLEAVMALDDEDALIEYVKLNHLSKDPDRINALNNIEHLNTVSIPVKALEFMKGSHTIWIQSIYGTTLRIKCTGKINTDVCENSPISHCDIMVNGDINFCLSGDAEF